jgi:aspartyl/asparaginyl beta-hydroxylase (cupin superfamily)
MMELQISTMWIERLLKKPFHKYCLLGDKKYFDPYVLPVAKELEDNFPAIQAEIKTILTRYNDFAPFQDISPDQTYISNDDKWRMFFFKAAGVNFRRNQSFAPNTFSILNRHKDIVSAYISVLGPRKMLMPHEGPWSGILRMHLGVVVPGNKECTLVNGGEEYHWEEGRVVLFDDTYEHIGVNQTDELRAILFLDVMRPLPQPWRFINWAILRLSVLFPYIWVPYFRHKRWEKKFYGESKCKSPWSPVKILTISGVKLAGIWQRRRSILMGVMMWTTFTMQSWITTIRYGLRSIKKASREL